MDNYLYTSDMREMLGTKLLEKDFVTDKTGVDMVEIVNASFIADEPFIFGTPSDDYIQREIAWYESCSLNVNDIPGETPKIWKDVADKDGMINSNYGYLIYHPDNGYQYDRTLEELRANPLSRRAVMIYTRPSMHIEYNQNGMSDFICTNAVQYLIRNDKLDAIVQMRSNDAVFGYKNDRAWQKHVQQKLSRDLEVEVGVLHWNAGSLHVYARHFGLMENWIHGKK